MKDSKNENSNTQLNTHNNYKEKFISTSYKFAFIASYTSVYQILAMPFYNIKNEAFTSPNKKTKTIIKDMYKEGGVRRFYRETVRNTRRRITSTVVAGTIASELSSSLEIGLVPTSIIGAIVETSISASLGEIKEYSISMGKGEITTSSNKLKTLSYIGARNSLFSLSIFCVEPTANLIMQYAGEELSENTKAKNIIDSSLRLTAIAATTPFDRSAALSSINIKPQFSFNSIFNKGTLFRTGYGFLASAAIAKGINESTSFQR